MSTKERRHTAEDVATNYLNDFNPVRYHTVCWHVPTGKVCADIKSKAFVDAHAKHEKALSLAKKRIPDAERDDFESAIFMISSNAWVSEVYDLEH